MLPVEIFFHIIFTKGEDFDVPLCDQAFLVSVSGQTKHSPIKTVPYNCTITSYFIIIKGENLAYLP